MVEKMIRTFHPVGQGAFYTERFYDEEQGKPVFTAVYDCGSVNVRQLKKAIDQTFGENDIINLLFVSHFHSDHVNKIEYLKKRCQVRYIVIPELTSGLVLDSLVHDFIQSDGSEWNNDSLQFLSSCINASYNNDGDDIRVVRVDVSGEGSEERRVIYLDRGDSIGPNVSRNTEIRFRDWIYVPYYVGDKFEELITELKPEFEKIGFVFNQDFKATGYVEALCDEIRKIDVDILRQIYGKVYKNNHNSYSMSVYSGIGCGREYDYDYDCRYDCRYYGRRRFLMYPWRTNHSLPYHVNCLYTGDYNAENGLNFTYLTTYFSRYWSRIGLVQVPHHGSEHNSDHKLYSHPDKLAIMSFGSKNRYGHPDSKTIDEIVSAGSVPIAVTEYGWTELRFEYRL